MREKKSSWSKILETIQNIAAAVAANMIYGQFEKTILKERMYRF
jgi:hypothetical protein